MARINRWQDTIEFRGVTDAVTTHVDGSATHVVYTDNRAVAVKDHYTTGGWGAGAIIDVAITSAQAEAAMWRKPLLIESGLHGISQPITYDYATGGDGDKTNTALIGENASGDVVGSEGTILTWAGTGAEHMVYIKSRGVIVEGIAFRVASGKTALSAVAIDKGAANVGTSCEVRRCQILGTGGHGGSSGQFTDGVVIGPTAGITNLDYNVVEDCSILGCTGAALRVASTTGQSKYNVFRNVKTSNCKYGIYASTGSYVVDGFFNARDLETVVNIGAASEPIVLRGLDVEHCDRLLNRSVGGTANVWPIVVVGARIGTGDPGPTSSDGTHNTIIGLAIPGTVHLIGCMLDYTSSGGVADPASWKILVGALAGGAPDGNYLGCYGCVFISAHPFKARDASGQPLRVDLRGCFYRTFSGTGPWAPLGHARLRDGLFSLAPDTATLPTNPTLDIPGTTGQVLTMQADGTWAAQDLP